MVNFHNLEHMILLQFWQIWCLQSSASSPSIRTPAVRTSQNLQVLWLVLLMQIKVFYFWTNSSEISLWNGSVTSSIWSHTDQLLEICRYFMIEQALQNKVCPQILLSDLPKCFQQKLKPIIWVLVVNTWMSPGCRIQFPSTAPKSTSSDD